MRLPPRYGENRLIKKNRPKARAILRACKSWTVYSQVAAEDTTTSNTKAYSEAKAEAEPEANTKVCGEGKAKKACFLNGGAPSPPNRRNFNLVLQYFSLYTQAMGFFIGYIAPFISLKNQFFGCEV